MVGFDFEIIWGKGAGPDLTGKEQLQHAELGQEVALWTSWTGICWEDVAEGGPLDVVKAVKQDPEDSAWI